MIEMEKMLKEILTEVKGIKSELKEVKEKVTNLEKGQNELKVAINNINDRLDDMDGRNANNHLEIRTKLEEMSNINNSLAEMYGQHEVEIRSLKRRPV